MALLQSARGRLDSDVLYDDVSLAQWQVQSLDKRQVEISKFSVPTIFASVAQPG